MSTPEQAPQIETKRPSTALVWMEVGATVWVYYLLITLVIAVPPFLFGAAGLHLNLRQGTAVTLGCTLVAELIALGLLVQWLRRSGRSLADLGWRRPTTTAALLVAVVAGIAYGAYTLMHPDIGRHAAEMSVLKLWGVIVGVAAAVVEEMVFRGFVLTELERIRVPVWGQVLTSGVTFGLIHIGFSAWGMALTFLLGMVLALLYHQGRRSLTAPIVSHALINAIIEPWLLLFTLTFYARMFAQPG
jgi:membrane protease YdiL (CAAX protease family)